MVGVAGFALPGNFVDIIVCTQADGSSGQAISKIVLERILVLAVAQEVARDETKPRVVNAVTLEVTPEQAEKLDLARSVGSLSLALRNQIDPRPGVTDGATKASLLDGRKAQLSAALPMPVAAALPVAASLGRPLAHDVGQPMPRYCITVLDGLRIKQECL